MLISPEQIQKKLYHFKDLGSKNKEIPSGLYLEETRNLVSKPRKECLNKTELINITNQAIQDILNLINGLDTQKYKGEFGKKSVESKRWVKGSELHDLNFINKDNQFAFFEEVKSTNRKPNSKRPNSLRWQSP